MNHVAAKKTVYSNNWAVFKFLQMLMATLPKLRNETSGQWAFFLVPKIPSGLVHAHGRLILSDLTMALHDTSQSSRHLQGVDVLCVVTQ